MAISRDGRMPLYYQIYDLLREEIESGVYLPGDRIPTESELSKNFGVSRVTVKQGIQKLVVDGLLYRQQGKGTFVTSPKVNRKLSGLISFHDEMLQKGFVPTTRLLEFMVVPARRVVAEALRLSEGEKVIRIKRLRLADGEVMAVQTSFVPHALCPELAKRREKLTGSLYKLLRQDFGLDPAAGRESYSAVVVRGADAAILGVLEGSPVFAVRRFACLADGRPVEYAESLLRADRYSLDVELSGSETGRR
ncbi:MAG: GntR family transcriptional regulator [Firmicutes bacterium]|nr:GntR family transcriptional regulator [Bacillota bacterium]